MRFCKDEYIVNPLLYKHFRDILEFLMKKPATRYEICEACGISEGNWRVQLFPRLKELDLVQSMPISYFGETVQYQIRPRNHKFVEELLKKHPRKKERDLDSEVEKIMEGKIKAF